MSKYQILTNILDRLRAEAVAAGFTRRFPHSFDFESITQARSRAYLHLFLKVKFGLLNPTEREVFITDGGQDGGVDAYFIDRSAKIIHFVQSKFRANQENFERKQIDLDELAAMDIVRITSGHETASSGVEYSGNINGLIRAIASTPDIARFTYNVIILANAHRIKPDIMQRLVDRVPTEIFDFQRCYQELVFPTVTGTYFDPDELHLLLDVSNKSAGAKVNYEVTTDLGPCEITVLFVPTLEIAQVMSKYKNSILKFNPRSYLELRGSTVNASIRKSILNKRSNEFALLNNGITMISDETSINERIGQKQRAQLFVKNPQIINGGQTAYTLSRIYEDHQGQLETMFDGKEVLLKIITLASDIGGRSEGSKRQLIERISFATNQQTAVSFSDRRSSEQLFVAVETVLFDRYGVLLERKKGQFQDGLKDGYVMQSDVLDRNWFFRIYLAVNHELVQARRTGIKLMERYLAVARSAKEQDERLALFFFGYCCLRNLRKVRKLNFEGRKKTGELLGQLYAMSLKYYDPSDKDIENQALKATSSYTEDWLQFVKMIGKREKGFVTYIYDRESGKKQPVFSMHTWVNSGLFEQDIRAYFGVRSDNPPPTGAADAAAQTSV